MTKDQFLKSKKFSVFGLPFDFQYSDNNRLNIFGENHTEKQYIDLRDNSFEVILPVFGVVQVINIALSHCELKE